MTWCLSSIHASGARLSYEEVVVIAEGYHGIWRLKKLMFFIKKLPKFKEKLIKLLFEYSMSQNFVMFANQAAAEYDIKHESYVVEVADLMESHLEKYVRNHFVSEEALRTSKSIGILENIRLCLQEMFFVCRDYGDFSECLTFMEEVFNNAKKYPVRHNAFIGLAQIYLFKGENFKFGELLDKCKEETWERDRSKVQLVERLLLYFIRDVIFGKFAEAKTLVLNHFDELSSEFLVIAPNYELIKIASLVVLATGSIREIANFLQLVKSFPQKCEEQYGLTDMFLSIKNFDFPLFFKYLRRIVPYVVNDMFLEGVANELMAKIFENTLKFRIFPYASIRADFLASSLDIHIDDLVNIAVTSVSFQEAGYTYDASEMVIATSNHSGVVSSPVAVFGASDWGSRKTGLSL